ncbi:MAG: M23 family metallopeptidase [Anaerolineae bacterium]|nr:M23 family metallopeptidase [Anaerolineae bacterium]
MEPPGEKRQQLQEPSSGRTRGDTSLVLPRLIALLVVGLWEWVSDHRSTRSLMSRASAHLALALIAVTALGLSALQTSPDFKPASPAIELFARQNPAQNAVASASLAPNLYRRFKPDPWAPIPVRANPHTEIPKRPRLGVITYTVQLGDTVEGIAAQFDLQPTTIMWANPAVEDAPDLLRIGQELIILPVDGVYHTVKEGETLESIAKKYKVTVEAITSCPYNNLQPPDYAIEPGMKLIVPGGEKPWVPKVVTNYTGPVPEGARGTGLFQWPVLGVITQRYWYGHRAIDIGVPVGTAVYAADSGFVSFAGWTDIGYGYLVVIDHANGFATYYAHLSRIYVTVGQKVERGQVIAASGNTGWSTGPHIHFEIRYMGVPQNPRAYLP